MIVELRLRGQYLQRRRGRKPRLRVNSTVNVEFIRELRPRISWAKPFVFPHSLTVYQRCVVFCTLTTGTPTMATSGAGTLCGRNAEPGIYLATRLVRAL